MSKLHTCLTEEWLPHVFKVRYCNNSGTEKQVASSWKHYLFIPCLAQTFNLKHHYALFNYWTMNEWSCAHSSQQDVNIPFSTSMKMNTQEHMNICEVCLPKRDCNVPSSVDAMSLSLSKPRPLSIHDWAVFSNTYNLHCIWSKKETRNKNLTSFCHYLLHVLNQEIT